MTGGKLSNAETNVIKDKLKNGQGKAVGEPVMPIFDADGVVIGYERSLAPEMIQKMRKNDNISEMIGAWAGRHVEEATAGEFNKKLVGSLKKSGTAIKASVRVNLSIWLTPKTIPRSRTTHGT